MIKTIHTYTLAIFILSYFTIFVLDISVTVLIIATSLIGPAYILNALCVELAAECTYPMGMGIVHGVMQMVLNLGQIACGVIFFSLNTPFTDPDILDNNTCNIKPDEDGNIDAPLDYTNGFFGLLGIYGVLWLFIIFGLKVEYKRRNLDKKTLPVSN